LFGSAIMHATLAPQVAPTLRAARAAESARAEDQQIAQEIVQILKKHKDQGQLKGFELDLQVENGVVWLKGHVSTSAQQQLVLDAAKQVSGVTKVVNRLELKSAEPAAKAAKTEPAPKAMLSSFTSAKNEEQADDAAPEELTPAGPAPVEPPSSRRSASGEASAILSNRPAQPVALSAAEAADDEEAMRATQASAFAAPVSEGSGPSDAQLAQSIVAKVNRQRSAGALQGFEVDLHVDQGTVWLAGRVASQAQQQLVLNIARSEPGVVQVVNDLTVAGGGPVAQTSGFAPTRATPMPSGQAVSGQPLAFAPASYHNVSNVNAAAIGAQGGVGPIPASIPAGVYGAPARYDHPQMPAYAYPSYGAYPNYAGVMYPRQYSPSTWPYIGPFYPYPQVPLGWRRVTLEWDDGWWWLDFKNKYD
jgi:osmotically-inducible protein OsmY